MKIIKTKTTIIDFDPEHERQRIMDLFDNPIYIDSLIRVIDVFEKDGLDSAYEVYDNLPYNEEDEYPLQESMGIWWHNIHGDLLYNEKAKVTEDTKIEILKH
jgi:hypothetical protein